MRRREFIGILGGAAAAAAWRPEARAQQPGRMRKIGVFSYEAYDNKNEKDLRAEFLERLRTLGWIENRSLQIEYRFAGNDAGRTRTFARELVALQPDVIFAGYVVVPALRAASATTPPIPSTASCSSVAFGDTFSPHRGEGKTREHCATLARADEVIE